MLASNFRVCECTQDESIADTGHVLKDQGSENKDKLKVGSMAEEQPRVVQKDLVSGITIWG